MRLLAVLALVTMLAAAPAGAVPALPTDIAVVPVYMTPPQMEIRWKESGHPSAYAYNVERVEPAPKVTVFASAPGGPAGRVVYVFDTAVASNVLYTYVIQVCDATGCATSAQHSNSPTIVWPIASDTRAVLHGFNELIGWAGLGDFVFGPPGTKPTAPNVSFHNGVDLQKTTQGAPGDDVLAPRGGVVTQTSKGDTADNGNIFIKVDVGGSIFENDIFNHLATDDDHFTSLVPGDVVKPGQRIGTIGTTHFGPDDFSDHVHFSIGSSLQPLRVNVRHGLSLFPGDAERDPGGKEPALCDENADGKTVVYRNWATLAKIEPDLANTPLSGRIVVEPEVCDEQGTSPKQAPIDLGYWIEGPLPDSEQVDDVKNAEHPYRLYDFRSDYYGAVPTVACTILADHAPELNAGCRNANGCSAKSSDTCDPSTVLREGNVPLPWPHFHHYIVTNAADEVGAKGAANALQNWNTAAKDDGSPVTANTANFADKPTTNKAFEARFPDGEYTIHVVASDLVHPNVDLPLPVVRLENFAPFLKEIMVAQDVDGNGGTGLTDLPGCEVLVLHYRHTAHQPYPRAEDLLVSKVSETLTGSGQKVCVKVRFSEPVSHVVVDLIGERGAGDPVNGSMFVGAAAKTFQQDDTWIGALVLPLDPSGSSDGRLGTDERDAAIRIQATDKRDAADTFRGLDANFDGTLDPWDANHVALKLDLSQPKVTVSVDKP